MGDKFKPKKQNKRKCQCIPTCPCPHPPALCGDPGTPKHMVRLGMTYSENSRLNFHTVLNLVVIKHFHLMVLKFCNVWRTVIGTLIQIPSCAFRYKSLVT